MQMACTCHAYTVQAAAAYLAAKRAKEAAATGAEAKAEAEGAGGC